MKPHLKVMLTGVAMILIGLLLIDMEVIQRTATGVIIMGVLAIIFAPVIPGIMDSE